MRPASWCACVDAEAGNGEVAHNPIKISTQPEHEQHPPAPHVKKAMLAKGDDATALRPTKDATARHDRVQFWNKL